MTKIISPTHLLAYSTIPFLSALAEKRLTQTCCYLRSMDLRPELNCFRKDYNPLPRTIDDLAPAGDSVSHRHYVHAPTGGASRYAFANRSVRAELARALFQRAKKWPPSNVPASLPGVVSQTRLFQTVSRRQKVSHHPGCRGGADWDDDVEIEMPGACWPDIFCPRRPLATSTRRYCTGTRSTGKSEANRGRNGRLNPS